MMRRLTDFAEIAARLGTGKTACFHSAFAEPPGLAQLLANHATMCSGTEILAFMPRVDPAYVEADAARHLRVKTFFPGPGLRAAMVGGHCDGLPIRLSEVPDQFERGRVRADVLLLQVSPPDADGYVSLGLSVDYMWDVLRQRPLVVAEINPAMPRTCGLTRLHHSAIDFYVDAAQAPQTADAPPPDAIDRHISYHVASLIDDGATLQIGIGSLPEQVLSLLINHQHLGLHSGIVSSAVQPLIESGVIDNARKTVMPGYSVTTMAGGSPDFYRFLDGNRLVSFQPLSVTHNPATLAALRKFTAINSVLQIDLNGQVNAERIGHRVLALPGGLKDFASGARQAVEGRSIVALRSTFMGERVSNVVPQLPDDAPRSLGAADIDFVVTDQGIADLRDKNPDRIARAVIEIAHPNFRPALEAARAIGPSASAGLSLDQSTH